MAEYAEGDWYEDATAYYDMVFAAGTEDECAFLQGVHERHGHGPLRRILEPACGSGRLVEALCARGHEVLGFDQSEAMLRFARGRLGPHAKRATLWSAQMQDFSVPAPVDLAHNFVSTFKYLLSEDDAKAHLLAVARALRPKGLYVLGFHLSEYNSHHRTRERWVAQAPGERVVCNIQSWPPCRKTRLERVRSRLLVEGRKKRRTLETNWTFRTYDARQVRALLASVPIFSHVATYDFCYDLARSRRLDDQQLDTVLVLQRGP